MTAQQKRIELKLKLLDYATKDMVNILARQNERVLKDKLKILEKSLEDINEIKYTVIEEMISEEKASEDNDKWMEDLQQSADPFDTMITDIKDVLKEINKTNSVVGKDATPSKDLSSPKDSWKRDFHTNAKLPKLQIEKFNGTQIDWFRF